MTHDARPLPFAGHIDHGASHFQAADRRRPLLQSCSSLCPLQHSPYGHPQIAQAKQRDQVRGVHGQPFLTHRVASKATLDDLTRVSNLGAYAGFYLPSAGCTKRSPHSVPLACMRAWSHASFNKQKGNHGGELGG